MQAFAALYDSLDGTTSTRRKVAAMQHYLQHAAPADASWAVYFLSGRRLKRLTGAAELRRWLQEQTGLSPWLFEEAYAHVGDLAETATLLLKRRPADTPLLQLSLHELIEERLLPLRGADEARRRRAILELWQGLPPTQQFTFNKIITGGLRVGVSQRLLLRALAEVSGVDSSVLAHRLMGPWQPGAGFHQHLLAADDGTADSSRPYPFFLASPLGDDPARLGPATAFVAEWKWDGIRGQVVRRDGQCFVWSRGGELMPGRFPEVEAAAAVLPDGTVIDGELLAWRDGIPLDFSLLQRRLGRKAPGATTLRQAPVRLMAYDLLEHAGVDLRQQPLEWRRQQLHELLRDQDEVLLSPLLEAKQWDDFAALQATARQRRTEGLMLKRRDSHYGDGRRRGAWWKWKVTPHSVDAILIYAQAGHGRRANLFTDYTFAVRDGDALKPIAKAYSGLSDAEIAELDRWIRRHTLDRYGPVRAVTPTWVFELAFDGIHASPRHKSGLALRFPRISRWRRDLGPADADSLEDLRRLLDP